MPDPCPTQATSIFASITMLIAKMVWPVFALVVLRWKSTQNHIDRALAILARIVAAKGFGLEVSLVPPETVQEALTVSAKPAERITKPFAMHPK